MAAIDEHDGGETGQLAVFTVCSRLDGRQLELTPGLFVTPNVRLTTPIGEGAMGSVWVAEHLTLETDVAVKFIHDDVPTRRDEAIARFRREASAAAKIKSPHIVQIFDQGVMEDGTPYMVMELLQGESLAGRLERVERMAMHQTAQIVTQVSKALRAAHKVGVVHRDIKPANIFLVPVDEGKLIKVLDFGIAKHQSKMPESRRLTQEGLLIGTPEYMCRDQIIQSCEADYRADLWALAVVTYECLCGDVPFQGNTVGMICANIIAGNFAEPSGLREDLPVELDRWFKRCFHEKPASRFATARDMALAFLRLLSDGADELEASLREDVSNFSLAPGPLHIQARPGTSLGLVIPQQRLPRFSLPDNADDLIAANVDALGNGSGDGDDRLGSAGAEFGDYDAGEADGQQAGDRDGEADDRRAGDDDYDGGGGDADGRQAANDDYDGGGEADDRQAGDDDYDGDGEADGRRAGDDDGGFIEPEPDPQAIDDNDGFATPRARSYHEDEPADDAAPPPLKSRRLLGILAAAALLCGGAAWIIVRSTATASVAGAGARSSGVRTASPETRAQVAASTFPASASAAAPPPATDATASAEPARAVGAAPPRAAITASPPTSPAAPDGHRTASNANSGFAKSTTTSAAATPAASEPAPKPPPPPKPTSHEALGF